MGLLRSNALNISIGILSMYLNKSSLFLFKNNPIETFWFLIRIMYNILEISRFGVVNKLSKRFSFFNFYLEKAEIFFKNKGSF